MRFAVICRAAKIFLVVLSLLAFSGWVTRYVASTPLALALILLTAAAVTGLLTKRFAGSQRGMGELLEIIKHINNNNLFFESQTLSKVASQEVVIEVTRLLDGLKGNFRQQADLAQKINQLSVSLREIAQESFETMSKVETQSNSICRDSERQAQALGDVAEKVRRIVSTMENMHKEMHVTDAATAESLTAAEKGIAASTEIQENMAAVNTVFLSAAQQIQSLHEYSESVANMVRQIDEIAGQTQMLALNAAIESARAGEAGRGFAVVAEEVGKLATKTTETSGQINRVISNLQNEMTVVVKSIQEGKITVDKSFSSIGQTAADLHCINEALQTAAAKVSDMGIAVANINQSGQAIASSINETTQFANDIFSKMAETNNLAHVHHNAIDAFRSTANSLENEADTMLQQIVSKVMEGRMLIATRKIIDTIQNRRIDETLITQLIAENKMDNLYITDQQGIVQYCNEKGGIGLNLLEIDPSLMAVKNRQKEYVATPIKPRVEDGRLFKFLGMADGEGRIIEIGMSFDSLLRF